MKRRDVLMMLGATAMGAASPARAQKAQPPVIGFLSSASPDRYSDRVLSFRQGLKEAGYLEGQNVEIVYR